MHRQQIRLSMKENKLGNCPAERATSPILFWLDAVTKVQLYKNLSVRVQIASVSLDGHTVKKLV
jgi:hypothetical protein